MRQDGGKWLGSDILREKVEGRRNPSEFFSKLNIRVFIEKFLKKSIPEINQKKIPNFFDLHIF